VLPVLSLAAEVAALEQSATDVDSFWTGAPCSSEGAISFAETRGYLMPEGLTAPAADEGWRRALLVETASKWNISFNAVA